MSNDTTRRVLVTGGNKGIGLAIVEGILAHAEDTFVLLGSRDPQRGAAAREALVQRRGDRADRVQVIELDVAIDASVAAAADRVKSRFAVELHPLYGIVNNAGIGLASTKREDVLNVNARGVQRVCSAFIPLLQPERGRVVNVTSAAGPVFVSRCSPERQRLLTSPAVTWSELEGFMADYLKLGDAADYASSGFGEGDAYGVSKAVANAYTLCLARELPSLTINACTPGFIETDMTRGFLANRGVSAEQAGMKSPAEGAKAPLHLLFGELEGNGRYYGSDSQRSPLDRYRSPGDPPYTGE